jgi:hypothetical protein
LIKDEIGCLLHYLRKQKWLITLDLVTASAPLPSILLVCSSPNEEFAVGFHIMTSVLAFVTTFSSNAPGAQGSEVALRSIYPWLECNVICSPSVSKYK